MKGKTWIMAAVVGLHFFSGACRVSESGGDPQPQTQANYLVVISLDGCRPDYFDLASLPNLQGLMDSGVRYADAWTGALESNTPPGHVQMATGTLPRHNGILGFAWMNTETGEKFNPTSLTAINNGQMDRIVAASGVPTIAGLVKERNAGDIVAAVSAEKYYAAQGLGIGPADFIVFSARDPLNKRILVADALRGHEPPAAIMNDPRLRLEMTAYGDENRFAVNAAIVLAERFRPKVLLINLPASDSAGHATGGSSAPGIMAQVMTSTDAALGDLLKCYRDAGIYDQTVWVITADHGMTAKRHNISPAGLSRLTQAAGIAGNMNPPYDYLTNSTQAPLAAEVIAAAHVPGILGAYAKRKTDTFWFYEPAVTTRLELDAVLNSAYLFLLESFAGPCAPDLVITTQEGYLLDPDDEDRLGAHNAVNWSDQHILTSFSGPGFHRGLISDYPARLVDILPTLCRVLGFSTSAMDGVVLADCMESPDSSDQSAFLEAREKLQPWRDALKQQGQK